MDATKEWLRYIESNAIQQKYNIKGYTSDNKDKENDNKSSEQLSANCTNKNVQYNH